MSYLCIHCHFYQPPRENPWLEAIELQDSAYPYHDWNERIAAECYGPNTTARILDPEGRIVRIVNNYSKVSFDFGPTLLSWAEEKAPALYRSIQSADGESRARFSGHGSAIAQAYNHMILPLANRRDRRTQAYWGKRDFQHRFGRDPEGMWLPETAVDLETLEILAELGIQFTILAPHQALRVRRIGGRSWLNAGGGSIDPTMAYRITLPSSRTMALFFYDGPVSRAVAFEGLLTNGEHFARRLMSVSSPSRTWPELIHIATDGESYGHHHRHGEMALAYALHHIEKTGMARLTNYGEYLEKHPPTHEVEIREDTSWSCIHGLERWKSNCGCNSGRAGWNQEWRRPLREALDWLRDETAPKFEQEAGKYLRDPWDARDHYIDVVLDRTGTAQRRFLEQHARPGLERAGENRIWQLLELQRHAMLMYTSCGWFFDELSGIETVQVIQYADRVVQLAGQLFGDTLEPRFAGKLAAARSNIPEYGDGAYIYEKFVKPARVDLHKVAAHYGISSMFHAYPEETPIFCYTARRQHLETMEAGRMRLHFGRARLISGVTLDEEELTFGFLHFGDHNITGGVRRFQDGEQYSRLAGELAGHFRRADVPEVIRLLDRGFGGNVYSLRSLFRDEQRSILNKILNSTLHDAEAMYRQLYERDAPLMRFLGDLNIPLPRAFQTTAEFALNSAIKEEMEREKPGLDRIAQLISETRRTNLSLDATTLEYTFRRRIEEIASRLSEDPLNTDLSEALERFLGAARTLPFPVNLRSVQNICYEILRREYPAMAEKAAAGDTGAAMWTAGFRRLAGLLSLRTE